MSIFDSRRQWRSALNLFFIVILATALTACGRSSREEPTPEPALEEPTAVPEPEAAEGEEAVEDADVDAEATEGEEAAEDTEAEAEESAEDADVAEDAEAAEGEEAVEDADVDAEAAEGEEAAEDTEAEGEEAGTDADAEVAAPRVYFAQPANNAVIPASSTVIMMADGLTVEPSGEINDGAGHMHILIDTDFIPAGEVVPNDEQHLHFGDGSVETTIELAPGGHVLRLQFADGAHIALEGEQYQDEIVVTVAEDAAEQAVYFVSPADGASVGTSLDVIMSATGLIIEPSGEIREGAGHLHILIDTDFIPAGDVIPNDEQHLHFGDGSLENKIELAPGERVLRLQFADGAHIALEGEQYQDEITITVGE